MPRRFFHLLVAALPVIFLFSCESKEKEPDPTVVYLGEIELYGENGLKEPDASGVEVTVLGTDPLVKGYTLADGSFRVEGVPIGRRRASLSKPGYGTFVTVEYNYRIEDGSNVNRFYSFFKIGRISTSTPSEVTASVEGNKIAVSGKLTPAATYEQPRQRQVFFSKSASVSKDNYQIAIGTLNSLSGTFKDYFDIEFLKTKGFASGDRIYVVVHGNTVASSPYIHPQTGVMVFPAISPVASNVTSVVLP